VSKLVALRGKAVPTLVETDLHDSIGQQALAKCLVHVLPLVVFGFPGSMQPVFLYLPDCQGIETSCDKAAIFPERIVVLTRADDREQQQNRHLVDVCLNPIGWHKDRIF
jgi:hypothetical protein